ncbi:MAG: multidrug ABC transporter, partial [Spirochaetae bacterium HGW-Spirochaetae-6]
MIYMAIITLSLFALSKLGIDLLPDITFPTITVVTTDYGVGPEEIEKNITERLEEVLGTVNNVKKMKSSSVEGLSIISIEFEWGTVMAEAAADIREKIDLVRDFLPETADTPFTFKFDMSMIPVMVFVIGGASLDQAKTFAEDVVKSELEQIEGVSQAR